MSRTIHTGVVRHEDGTFTYYIVDDVDSLPPDISEYHERDEGLFSYMEMFKRIGDGERIDGYSYVVQIGDLYYETLDREVVDG